jgi:hypothetical protein
MIIKNLILYVKLFLTFSYNDTPRHKLLEI